jgi:gamma-glutamylcyclotransferase
MPLHPPRAWFAFSIALAPELARERLGGESPLRLTEGEVAHALDVDLIYDVPSEAWGGLVARMVDAPGRHLVGRVRAIPAASWPLVARMEESLALATDERPVRLRTPSGSLFSARAFTPLAPRAPTPGLVSVAYLLALARAAEHAKLPADDVSRLQAEARLVQAVQRSPGDRPR